MHHYQTYLIHWDSFSDASWSDYALRDIAKQKDVTVLYPPKWMKHPIVWNLYQKCIHSDTRSLQRLWLQLCFRGSHLSKRKPIIFIMDDSCCCLKNNAFLKWLKNHCHIKLVLTAWNMVKDKHCPKFNLISVKAAKKYFDLIISSEPRDAEKYQLSFFPGPFASKVQRSARGAIRSDLCFSGQDKDRLDLIKAIKQAASENDVNCDFRVLADKSHHESLTGIRYTDKWQPYQALLDQALSSNCILEIMQNGQDGLTLRTREAIALNKKLLSNNKALYKNRYYDPRYIQIFDTPAQIDFHWVKERQPVDYHYQGDWSFRILLQQIIQAFNQ